MRKLMLVASTMTFVALFLIPGAQTASAGVTLAASAAEASAARQTDLAKVQWGYGAWRYGWHGHWRPGWRWRPGWGWGPWPLVPGPDYSYSAYPYYYGPSPYHAPVPCCGGPRPYATPLYEPLK